MCGFILLRSLSFLVALRLCFVKLIGLDSSAGGRSRHRVSSLGRVIFTQVGIAVSRQHLLD